METTIQNKIKKACHVRHGLDGVIHWIRPIKQGNSGAGSSLLYAKNKTLIPVELSLEQSSCYQLEVGSGIYSYRTQALAFPYRVRAITRFSYLLFAFTRIGIWRCFAAVARGL